MRRTLRGARGLAVALGGKTQQQQKRVQHAPITLKKIRSEHGTTMCGVLARTLRSSNFTSAGVAHRGGGVIGLMRSLWLVAQSADEQSHVGINRRGGL